MNKRDRILSKGDKIAMLSDLAFKANHLAEKHTESETVIRHAIRSRSLFDLLQGNHKREPLLINDFSYYTEEQKEYLHEVLGEVENCYIKEDCGVEENGYNLLVAFALMCIQTECG